MFSIVHVCLLPVVHAASCFFVVASPLAETEAKKIETPAPAPIEPATAPETTPAPVDVVPEEKVDDSKGLAAVEKTPDSPKEKKGSQNRDIVLGRLDTEKKLSYIKAWEENEKSKAENKAQKKISGVVAWENSKKASLEASLKKVEEELEKKKAGYAERMKNKLALVHKKAEEKRAMIEAQRGEEVLKADETSAKLRATGQVPKKLLGCF